MNSEHHIFFLQLTKDLPPAFFELASLFSKVRISLVPVEPKDFLELSKGKKPHLISLTDNINALRMHVRIRKIFLDWGVVNKRFYLYNLTSFESATANPRLLKMENFHHVHLPIAMLKLVRDIAKEYYEEQKVVRVWPGRRAPRLAPQIIEGK